MGELEWQEGRMGIKGEAFRIVVLENRNRAVSQFVKTLCEGETLGRTFLQFVVLYHQVTPFQSTMTLYLLETPYTLVFAQEKGGKNGIHAALPQTQPRAPLAMHKERGGGTTPFFQILETTQAQSFVSKCGGNSRPVK